jgi:hypothetical protein
MLRIIKPASLVILISCIIGSCGEIESYPDTPIIEYKSFSLYYSTDTTMGKILKGKMEVYFTDGDGDIGLEQPNDTIEADSLKFNFFTSLYSINEGVFEKVPDENGLQNFRIPYITRGDQNKTIKGSIFLEFEYRLLENDPILDTIFYTFYLVDRELHKSNTDTSDVLNIYRFRFLIP